MRWLTRLDIAAGEYVCRRLWDHDHDYVDDPPTLTELVAFLRWHGPTIPLGASYGCPTCGEPLRVEADSGDLWVACANDHEVSAQRDRLLWERGLTANGYVRVCANWWEQHVTVRRAA